MVMRILDYVFYRIDDFYRRNNRWHGGALGGYSAVILMAGLIAIWILNVMVMVWFKYMPPPTPYWFKPFVLISFILFILLLRKRYIPIRRELRSRYISEPRDGRWRRKGYLITFVILFSMFFLIISSIVSFIIFREVVYVPQH